MLFGRAKVVVVVVVVRNLSGRILELVFLLRRRMTQPLNPFQTRRLNRLCYALPRSSPPGFALVPSWARWRAACGGGLQHLSVGDLLGHADALRGDARDMDRAIARRRADDFGSWARWACRNHDASLFGWMRTAPPFPFCRISSSRRRDSARTRAAECAACDGLLATRRALVAPASDLKAL